MKKLLDLVYSEEETKYRLMDVFCPDAPNGAAIYFVHGGGWSGGSRQQWHGVMDHFCGLGYVCASVEYRLLPDFHFPQPFEDVRLGMSWFKARAGEYGFDANRVAVWGSSAGGHLASLLAVLDPASDLGMTEEVKDRDTSAAAAVCYCTLFSVHREGGYYKPDFFGVQEEEAPELYREASPIDHVTGGEPPFVMIVGDADTTTPPAWHETMKEKLEICGGAAELHVLPGAGHGFGYGMASEHQKSAAAHAAAFLKRVL